MGSRGGSVSRSKERSRSRSPRNKSRSRSRGRYRSKSRERSRSRERGRSRSRSRGRQDRRRSRRSRSAGYYRYSDEYWKEQGGPEYRISRDGSMFYHSRRGGRPFEIRPGDWTCMRCRQNNFARNHECYRCRERKGRAKETLEVCRKEGVVEGPSRRRRRSRSSSRSRSRSRSRSHRRRRRDSRSSSRSPRSRSRSRSASKGKTEWTCKNCHKSNSYSDKDCYNCDKNPAAAVG